MPEPLLDGDKYMEEKQIDYKEMFDDLWKVTKNYRILEKEIPEELQCCLLLSFWELMMYKIQTYSLLFNAYNKIEKEKKEK